MSNINNGGPAYPNLGYNKEANYNGMTLRDYFAGQALIALPHRGCGADVDYDDTATAAYQIADAMLKAREVAQ